MNDADGDGIWTLTVPLEGGRSYQYKYVVNGSEWITDPWAEATDPNNFNNAILYTRRPDEPYFTSFIPADGAHVSALLEVSAVLRPQGRVTDSLRVHLTDGFDRSTWRLSPTHDAATGRITASPPPDLPDGDYSLIFEAHLSSASPFQRRVQFTLDRWSGIVESPPFWDDAVLYEIFVRSFKDGKGNDGIGDLAGLTAALDYLNDGNSETRVDLGGDAVWLMPVHPSPSDHGYDVTDYEGIEEDYGTLDDYRRFVDEAHRRGIRVVLDFVANHSSNQHPFFRSAHRNPKSIHSAWYKFTDAGNETYAGFAGYGGMPELNFRSVELRTYLLHLALFWIDLDGDGDLTDGVDGFRFDVAKGPPHDFWRQLRREIKPLRGDFLLLGEVWDNETKISHYFHNQFDMNFDYPMYYALLDLLAGRKGPKQFSGDYERIRDAYPPGSQLVRFLDNHDNNRLASVLGGDPARQKLATGILFTLPGTPLVYYGMEIGMQGSKPDPDIRKPMRWDFVEAQTGDPASLLSWHRDLIRLRKALPALRARDDDAARSLFFGNADAAGVMVYERTHAGSTAVVVANLEAKPTRTTIRVTGKGSIGKARARVSIAHGIRPAADDPLVDLSRGWSLECEPFGFAVFELTSP